MPALKLSQRQRPFCAISQSTVVELDESQGCLPHQASMQPPAIDTAAKCSARLSSKASATPDSATDYSLSWQCLPLQTLTNFELVNHQFAALQVWFESAIALRPSNPSFQADESALTLMAFYHKSGFKVNLGQNVAAVDFGFISSEPLMISGLDAEGHCVSMVKTTDLPAFAKPEELNQRPIQGITLDTHGAKTIRIDSVAPFVVTRFWVKQGEPAVA